MGTEIDGVNGIIKNTTSDGDITIKGNDGGSEISALVFDMSAAGTATFNSLVGINKAVNAAVGLSVGSDANSSTSFGLEVTDSSVQTRFLVDGLGSQRFFGSDNAETARFTNGKLGIGTVDPATTLDVVGATTITTADNTDTLTLTSTDTDANGGPNLRLLRSATGADADTLGVIDFAGKDDGGNLTDYARIEVVIDDASDGSEDASLIFRLLNGGALNQTVKMTGPETVINDASIDHDFRVESNGNANMLFVDGGNDRVNIGSTDVAGTLVVSNGDSGQASLDSNANEFCIEDNASAGMTILTPNDTSGFILFGDSDANNSGIISYDHSNNSMKFGTGGSTLHRFTSGGVFSANESAPDASIHGITLNQAGGDTGIITLKSSDVAHGQTGGDETDTYAKFSKVSATSGGLKMQTYSEGETAFKIDGRYTTDNTTKGTGASCPVQIDVRRIDGTSVTTPGADANMFSVTNNGQTKFLVDEDGDIHNDGSVTAYDNYEDAQLVRAFDLSHGKGVIDSKFDKFISYNHEALADMKLVGREEDGTPNHFVNVTGMQRLHNGAIWQQYEKTEKLANAIYELAKAAVGEEKANEILEQNEIKLLN